MKTNGIEQKILTQTNLTTAIDKDVQNMHWRRQPLQPGAGRTGFLPAED
jgi:hypothetical protein